uniref:Mitogen-activated protein kinase kinase kinase 20 n=1 Tax=Panagrellus redivivus TaxID=6233 RepID=A0A7E4UX48_PANRE
MSSSSESRDETKLISYPRIPREDLEVLDQLGCGSFGSVYKGIWRKDNKEQEVALKKVFMLEKEVDILSQIRHRNIIQFFGVSNANPDFYIVTEFAENGSLYEYLHNDSAALPFDLILQWALQIAFGVAYLHNEAPATIIHRDLKSKNIVLSKDLVCKLCDFGTSKDLTHSWTMPTWAGTAAWMSPEIISQKEGITPATDVWSYAVVLWELVSREVPYKGLTEFKIYSIITQHGERLVIPETCPMELGNLLKDCWHTNPRDRIDMKTVILRLEMMESNAEVHLQCTNFVMQKDDWRHEIETQLHVLNELKIDLARQKEELERREQALTRRETSHRSFMHLQELASLNDLNSWTEGDVCTWLTVLADNAPEEVEPEIIDRLIQSIKQYEIDGPRLFNVTPKDLKKLGLTKGPFLTYLMDHIEELTSRHAYDFVDYPSLRMSSIIEQRNKSDKSKQPFDFPLIIHVGMYQREVCSTTCSSRFRFKIFVDTDWQECTMTDSMPSEIYDSATVIKDVCITLVDSNKEVLLETVRCLCPPFGYLEWINAPQSGPVFLTCSITYTDQVMRPRNTCIKAEISEFSKPQTIHNRVVMLKIRPIATNTSLTRINSALFNNSLERRDSSTTNLQGAWRRRRSSFGTEANTPDRNTLNRLQGLQNLQAWSTVAGPRSEYQHSMSVQDKDNHDDFPGLPVRSTSYAAPSPSTSPQVLSRPRVNPFNFRRNRLNSERSNEDGATPGHSCTNSSDKHPSFFLDSSSPPVIYENGDSVEFGPKVPSPEPAEEKCCKNNCRHRKGITPAFEISNIDEMAPLILQRKKKKPANKSAKAKPPRAPLNGTSVKNLPIDENLVLQNNNSSSNLKALDSKKCAIEEGVLRSQRIYGGYNKWRWK